jgi:hypothetical protein
MKRIMSNRAMITTQQQHNITSSNECGLVKEGDDCLATLRPNFLPNTLGLLMGY